MPVKERQPFTDRRAVNLAVEPPTINPARLKFDYSQIDEAHREQVQFATIAIQDHMSRASDSIIRAGQELIEIKAILPHGQFGEWIDAEFGLSVRMAQRMMAAAQEYGSNATRVSHFSASAIYLLAAPGTPDEARAEVEATAQATGKPPTRKEVQATIRKHKPLTMRQVEERLFRCADGMSDDASRRQMLQDIIDRKEGWGWYGDLVRSYVPEDTDPERVILAAQTILAKYAPKSAPEPAPPVYEPPPQQPETPGDLLAAGYVIEGHWSGKFCWKFANPHGPGAQFGALVDSVEAAVEDARRNIVRGVRFYREREVAGDRGAQVAGAVKTIYTEPQPETQHRSDTVTLSLERRVAEQLHAALLVGALRFDLSHEALKQLKESLREVLS